MDCTQCGSKLAPDDLFCYACGVPIRRLPASSETTANAAPALNARYEAGELDDIEYDAALAKLVLQDTTGWHWMLALTLLLGLRLGLGLATVVSVRHKAARSDAEAAGGTTAAVTTENAAIRRASFQICRSTPLAGLPILNGVVSTRRGGR